MKKALGWVFRVFEQLPVLGQVGHRLQAGSHGFDVALFITFHHVAGHVPPLYTVGEICADEDEPFAGTRILALSQPLVVELLPVFRPGLHVDIWRLGTFRLDQGGIEHDCLTLDIVDWIAQPLFDDKGGDAIVHLGTVPAKIGEDDGLLRQRSAETAASADSHSNQYSNQNNPFHFFHSSSFFADVLLVKNN